MSDILSPDTLSPDTVFPQSIVEVQELVRSSTAIFPRGAGTKSALAFPDLRQLPDSTSVALSGLSGILEYQPDEYTFTALAGTPITTVEETLAEQGQYLPFEPPFDQLGATLGGTIAAGLSGAGRYRYGGVRDFLIGVRFVDGNGDVVMGGGKVVKNAAGFDSPKLMVGSQGRLGIMVEMSFKVFPAPATYRTLRIEYPSLAAALEGLSRLAVAPMDIDAVELLPDATSETVQMLIRIGGIDSVLYARLGRLEDLLMDGEIIDLAKESDLWHGHRNFDWADDAATIVKIPISPNQIAAFDQRLGSRNVARVYSVGGHVCWLAWSAPLADLEALLLDSGLLGLALRHGKKNGPPTLSPTENFPYLGERKGLAFGRKVQHGIDPHGRFLPI